MTRMKLWILAALVAGAWLGAVARGQNDGSIVGWGDNSAGQCSVPAPNTGFVAVAAGGLHSLGVKADGSIVAWGDNSLGQCNVPAPNTGFVAVAAGFYHSLGVRADGSIVAWGDNSYGQSNFSLPSGFVAVAAGGYHSLALLANGSIAAGGGQLLRPMQRPCAQLELRGHCSDWVRNL